MASLSPSPQRSGDDTRARIVAAAQRVFAAKGYAGGNLREIAGQSDVAVSLVIKYFGTKADLFRRALEQAIIDPQVFQADRADFGRKLIAAMADRDYTAFAPAMIALSIGDEEARDIVVKVARESILEPMADWLGKPDAGARANAILMLTTGFLLLGRHIDPDGATSDYLARALQAAVEG